MHQPNPRPHIPCPSLRLLKHIPTTEKFMAARLRTCANHFLPFPELYRRYELWCADHQFQPETIQAFAQDLARLGHPVQEIHGVTRISRFVEHLDYRPLFDHGATASTGIREISPADRANQERHKRIAAISFIAPAIVALIIAAILGAANR